MELAGRVIAVLEARSGLAKTTGNPWMTQEYVIETHEQFTQNGIQRVWRGENQAIEHSVRRRNQCVLRHQCSRISGTLVQRHSCLASGPCHSRRSASTRRDARRTSIRRSASRNSTSTATGCISASPTSCHPSSRRFHRRRQHRRSTILRPNKRTIPSLS